MWRRGGARSRKQPIYEHITANLREGGVGLTPEGEDLPDDVPPKDGVRFAPGLLEALTGAGEPTPEKDARVDGVWGALEAALARTDDKRLAALEEAVREENFLYSVDRLLERLVALGPSVESVIRVGERLVRECATRNGVKLGIAMLGMIRSDRWDELYFTLGRHPSFTWYAAIALRHSRDEPTRDLFALARSTEGWARIHAVRALDGSQDPEVADWLLRQGFRSGIVDEELAYIAATTGDLLGALKRSELDDELIDGADDLIRALIHGGPAQDIRDYQDGDEAVDLLLGHFERMPERIRSVYAADAIATWAEGAGKPAIAQRARDFRDRPDWPAKGQAALDAPEPSWYAVPVGTILGLDVTAPLLTLAERKAEVDWYSLMGSVDEARIETVVALAEERLDLDGVLSTPRGTHGHGPGWRIHGDLQAVVNVLARFPQRGWSIVDVALRSPITVDRMCGMRAVAAWPDPSPVVVAAVRGALDLETDETLATQMREWLDGQPRRTP